MLLAVLVQEKLDYYPDKLSGGQKQRIAIAFTNKPIVPGILIWFSRGIRKVSLSNYAILISSSGRI
ncbi:MAG: hypothetical protein KME60_08075 [Cyanomargarita calcarea GSE-NOS-MK-12-04C]|uniref:ABC transporter domain-containing protein n=1 Tax=Cyanomargarita calcarea GSE-NOS-MK-12-04C TaxID=2839659 RepID=A0A951US47_9CYAN|nr:hypothetical protein [Cyanomargarita calcarea GSE-NOS-MK-12-04C]